ncbi:MAG: hypothetical protein NZ749_14795, partial [bacterium]|nr:hypothetical protein [bacterium]
MSICNLRWVSNRARQSYEQLSRELHARLHASMNATASTAEETLATAELHIILGQPLRGLSLLKEGELPGEFLSPRRILQARAFRTMRLTEVAAQILYHAVQNEGPNQDYDACLELARMNSFLAYETRD